MYSSVKEVKKCRRLAYMQMHAHTMPFNVTALSRYAFTTITVDKAKRDTVFLLQLCGAVSMQFGYTKGCIQKSKRYSYELKINQKYFCVFSF